jgi:hypothetical protein
MVKIAKKVLAIVVLLMIAAAPLACLNVNTPPKNRDVNVGGQHGVTVHEDNSSSN